VVCVWGGEGQAVVGGSTEQTNRHATGQTEREQLPAEQDAASETRERGSEQQQKAFWADRRCGRDITHCAQLAAGSSVAARSTSKQRQARQGAAPPQLLPFAGTQNPDASCSFKLQAALDAARHHVQAGTQQRTQLPAARKQRSSITRVWSEAGWSEAEAGSRASRRTELATGAPKQGPPWTSSPQWQTRAERDEVKNRHKQPPSGAKPSPQLHCRSRGELTCREASPTAGAQAEGRYR
jgi:hypothetical protein